MSACVRCLQKPVYLKSVSPVGVCQLEHRCSPGWLIAKARSLRNKDASTNLGHDRARQHTPRSLDTTFQMLVLSQHVTLLLVPCLASARRVKGLRHRVHPVRAPVINPPRPLSSRWCLRQNRESDAFGWRLYHISYSVRRILALGHILATVSPVCCHTPAQKWQRALAPSLLSRGLLTEAWA